MRAKKRIIIVTQGRREVKSIKAVALDVDGVLTDGDFLWGPDSKEWKRFSFSVT